MTDFNDLMSISDDDPVQGGITLQMGPRQRPDDPGSFETEVITEPPAPTAGEEIDRANLRQFGEEALRQESEPTIGQRIIDALPPESLGRQIDRQLRVSKIDMASRGLLLGILETLELPGNVIRGILNTVTDPLLDFEFQQAPIRDHYVRSGILPAPGMEPQDLIFESARFAGQNLPFAAFGPAAAASRGPAAFTPGIGPAIKEAFRSGAEAIGRFAIQKPGSFATIETAGSVAAGVGIFASKRALERSSLSDDLKMALSPTVETLGGLASGGIGAGLATVSPVRLVVSNLKAGAKGIRNAYGKGAAATRRAKKRIQREIVDIGKARKELKETSGLPEIERLMTPIQKTGDEGLLALEVSILNEGNDVDLAKANKQLAMVNDAIIASLEEPSGAVQAARDQMAANRAYILTLLKAKLGNALLRIKDRLSKIASTKSGQLLEDVASREARAELDDAYEVVKATEKELWEALPSELPMDAEGSMSAYMGMVMDGDAVKAEVARASFPPIVKKFLGHVSSNNKFIEGRFAKEQPTLGNLKNLRTEILEEIEVLRKAPNRKKRSRIRMLDELQKAILNDMGAESGNIQGEVGEQLSNAIFYSNQKGELFERGPIGRILGIGKAESDKISAALTLDDLFGSGGIKAEENIGKAIDALDLSETSPNNLMWAVEDWLKTRFVRDFVHRTKVDPNTGKTIPGSIDRGRAERWIEINRTLLRERFPEFLKDIEDAIIAQDSLLLNQRRFNNVNSRLARGNTSKAAIYLAKDPDTAFNELLKSSNPASDIQTMIREVRRDKTGEALEGLRDSFVGWLMRRSQTGHELEGAKGISGFKLKRLLEEPNVRVVLDRLMPSDRIDRIERIANSALKFSKRLAAGPSKEGVLEDLPSKSLSIMARLFAARASARATKATGGIQTIQVPHIATQNAEAGLKSLVRDAAKEATIEATKNERMLLDFLEPIDETSKASLIKAKLTLNTWMAALVFRHGGIIVEPTEEERQRTINETFERARDNQRFLP